MLNDSENSSHGKLKKSLYLTPNHSNFLKHRRWRRSEFHWKFNEIYLWGAPALLRLMLRRIIKLGPGGRAYQWRWWYCRPTQRLVYHSWCYETLVGPISQPYKVPSILCNKQSIRTWVGEVGLVRDWIIALIGPKVDKLSTGKCCFNRIFHKRKFHQSVH